MPKSLKKSTPANSLKQLYKIAESGVYFTSTRDEPFVEITRKGHKRNIPVNGKQFSDWLRNEALNVGLIVTGSNVRDVTETMAAKASFSDMPRQIVFRRVASKDGNIFYDLCNDQYEAVEIRPDGWNIISNPPVRFQRLDGMGEMPHPKTGGTISDLTDLLNLPSQGDAALLTAFCVHCLQPNGPFPLVVINGSKGSSKSTLTRTLVGLIDPNTDPLKQFPRSQQDLAIALDERLLVAFDNVSTINHSTSDMMARISTGASFSARKLFTDKELIKINLNNPIIINGIPQSVDQPDLADRAIFIHLDAIKPTKRIRAEEYWEKFSEVQPYIFGLLMDGVTAMLANRQQVELAEIDRMADFHVNAVASETAFWPVGTFELAYQSTKQRWHDSQISKAPLAEAIIKLFKMRKEKAEKWTGWTAWTGTVKDLLNELEYLNENYGVSNFPKNEEQLGKIIVKIKPILHDNGIGIESTRDSTVRRTRGYRIYIL